MVRNLEIIINMLVNSFIYSLIGVGITALLLVGSSYFVNYQNFQVSFEGMRWAVLVTGTLSFVITLPMTLKAAKYEVDE